MTCYICGGTYEPVVSDMPFKLAANRIVILKALPVLECRECGAEAITDPVMERVEALLAGIDASAELEILRYAA